MSNQIHNFLSLSKKLFFEPSLFLCLISCFSSLRRPYSLSVPCFLDFWAVLEITFLDFLFYLSSFRVSSQKIVVVFGHNFQKISLILVRKITLGKNPLFSWFWHFFYFWFVFFMHDLEFFHFLSFSYKYLVSFVLISFFLLKKKNTSKNKLILFIFVFTLLVLTLPEMLSLDVFILSFFSIIQIKKREKDRKSKRRK